MSNLSKYTTQNAQPGVPARAETGRLEMESEAQMLTIKRQ